MALSRAACRNPIVAPGSYGNGGGLQRSYLSEVNQNSNPVLINFVFKMSNSLRNRLLFSLMLSSVINLSVSQSDLDWFGGFISPQSGEIVDTGTEYRIVWEPGNVTGTVTLNLNGGNNTEAVELGRVGVIAENIDIDAEEYNWAVVDADVGYEAIYEVEILFETGTSWIFSPPFFIQHVGSSASSTGGGSIATAATTGASAASTAAQGRASASATSAASPSIGPGAMVGIAVGGVALVGLVGGLVGLFLYYKRKSRTSGMGSNNNKRIDKRNIYYKAEPDSSAASRAEFGPVRAVIRGGGH
ncbi:hypothetical protein BX600DRAFT_526809 [Xylariales sp. PMI_506]|nr:hypothetical protein BX600DRAFT_526809 [Xylariales sp. PMI_506]